MISQEQIDILKEQIAIADAIVVGGASGMSAASGFKFYYQHDEVFQMIAGNLEKKYGFYNFFDGLYDPHHTLEEHWAMLIRLSHYIHYCDTGETYKDLAALLEGKNYYIATTNQDAQFYRVFDANKITRIQGDWRYWQCKKRCHDQIYDNKEQTLELSKYIEADKLTDALIPRCPKCGGYMDAWIRSRNFLEGNYYQQEMKLYYDFIEKHAGDRILFLELGVGLMTPMFIKKPFISMVYQLPNAFYATLNPQHAIVPEIITSKGLALSDDISIILKQLLNKPIDPVDHFDTEKIFNPSRVY